MNTSDELSLIDTFEARHGNTLAVERARKFLVAYLDEAVDLPEIAKRGLEVAKEYDKGDADLRHVQDERNKFSHFLRERKAWTKWTDPYFGPIHAVYAILWHCEYPNHGGGASELISDSLVALQALKPDNARCKSLLREYFGTD